MSAVCSNTFRPFATHRVQNRNTRAQCCPPLNYSLTTLECHHCDHHKALSASQRQYSSLSASSSSFCPHQLARDQPVGRRRHCLPCPSSALSDANSGDVEDSQDSPVDWREFRARLVENYSGAESPQVSDSAIQEGDLDRVDAEAVARAQQNQIRNRNQIPRTQSWAHPLVLPEPGCILLAHPAAFGQSQQYFNRAVIFLFAHSEEGSAGVILNRPTEYRLSDMPGFEDLQPEFAGCPLYMGGDVGRDSTHVLHGVGEVEGSKEIVRGVYVGGYSKLKAHVMSGKSTPMDYRWFARYSGWGPGQLEKEAAAGYWFLASCSADLILRHCEMEEVSSSLWKDCLELMGGDYATLVKRSPGSN